MRDGACLKLPTAAAREADYQWIRVSRFDRRYELRDGTGAVHAQLNFDALIGRQATGRANGHEWTFSAEGWLRPRVSALEAGSGAPPAQMAMRWLGWAGRGELTLTDGRQFDWRSSLLTDRRWVFTERSGVEAVVFEKPVLRQAGNADLLCGRLRIDPSFKTDRAIDLLAVLSMYLNG
jgi:hypothetical protein